ncbi:MAG: response regulator [Candidatus Omnitrophota bacterium]|nr:response regulator [Candidatus Omnitrophota bacterium]
METRKKILVVDDEADIRAFLRRRLEASQFEVLEAADGFSAIVRAGETRPDLILLDILMPGKDGIETYHALKQDPSTSKIPIIFLSALAKNTAPAQHNLGPDEGYAILGKPYQAEELLQTIHQALSV